MNTDYPPIIHVESIPFSQHLITYKLCQGRFSNNIPYYIDFTVMDRADDIVANGRIWAAGCSDWRPTLFHICGVYSLHQHYRALNACYIIAQTFMPEAH